MSSSPLISIVITSYNYGRFLNACIDSALAQTYRPLEVIVIDDGSKDDSPHIILSYGDRIQSVLKANEGPASSWNLGFSMSKGEFVCFLDSDDTLLPTALENALPLFADSLVVRVQWPLFQIDEHGKRTGGLIPGAELHEGHLRDALLRNGPASYMSSPTSGNLWRRSFLEKALPVPPQFKLMCDAYLMTVSPLHGAIRRLVEPQACYRTHGKNDYHGMSFLPRLERDIRSFEHRCQLLRNYCAEQGIIPDEAGWLKDSWFYRLRNVTQEIQRLVPEGNQFLLVENGNWGADRSIGRTPLPFLEKDGMFYGAPGSDQQAIDELERMRAQGATHIVFGWPAFWWMEHYPAFAKYLRERYAAILETDDLKAFSLARNETNCFPKSLEAGTIPTCKMKSATHHPSSLTSRAAAILSFFAVFLVVLTAYVSPERMPGVLSLLFTDGSLAVAWIACAVSCGSALLNLLNVERRGALEWATSAALGLGVISLIALGLGLIGWLNTVTAVVLLLVCALIEPKKKLAAFEKLRKTSAGTVVW